MLDGELLTYAQIYRHGVANSASTPCSQVALRLALRLLPDRGSKSENAWQETVVQDTRSTPVPDTVGVPCNTVIRWEAEDTADFETPTRASLRRLPSGSRRLWRWPGHFAILVRTREAGARVGWKLKRMPVPRGRNCINSQP